MQVSSDFLLRTIGANDGIVIPVDKVAVRDYVAEIILKRLGDHQVFLDISRCASLSAHFCSFLAPSLCPQLVYLDISYTTCDDLGTIFTRCPKLRALNIAGTQLMQPTLDGIEQLTDLEFLSIRSTNIHSVAAVKQCSVLRSLDFGHTSLSSVTESLERHTRLEELLLDNCQQYDPREVLVETDMELPSLRLINVHEGQFADHADWFTATARQVVYEETCARRQLFFAAVVQDNAPEMHRLLTCGQDIDMRVTEQDVAFLTQKWTERCTFPKYRLQTPFFLCTPDIPNNLWPTAIHLAVFFNSVACLQTLVDCHANADLFTVLADVKLSASDPSRLEENASSDATASSRRKVNAKYLVELAFDRKVHRLTENMITSQVANWKNECARIRKKLEAVLQYGSQMKKSQKAAASSPGRSQPEDGQVMRKSPSRRRMSVLPPTLELEDVGEEQSVASGISAPSLERKASWASVDEHTVEHSIDNATETSSLSSYTFVNPDGGLFDLTRSKAERAQRPKILPPKEFPFQWRDHGMVRALSGPPRIITVHRAVTQAVEAPTNSWLREAPSSSTKMLASQLSLRHEEPVAEAFEVVEYSVLGKKNFWLESRALTIKKREEEKEKEGGSNVGETKKAANLGVYSNLQGFLKQAKQVYPRQQDLEEDWLAGRNAGHLPLRKKLFMKAVREKMEQKFNDHLS